VVWAVISLVSTMEESRTTWLLMGIVALAGRLAEECPERLAACFAAPAPAARTVALRPPIPLLARLLESDPR
jgi:hypothetical protein